MKKILVAVLSLILFCLSGCAQAAAGSAQIDGLNQQIRALEEQQQQQAARLDALEQRLSVFEEGLAVPAEERAPGAASQPAEPTLTPPADYSAYMDPGRFTAYLPAAFPPPFPASDITKAILVQEPGQTRIILVYAQPITASQAEQMAEQLGWQIDYVPQGLGDLPAWKIRTDADSGHYTVQTIDPGVWQDDYIESAVPATAVYFDYSAANTPDLSDWFTSDLFAYSDYLLPSALAGRTPNSASVAWLNDAEEGIHVETASKWTGLDQADISAIFEHYTNALKDHEWFDVTGDAGQFGGIYARLDTNRSIYIKVQPEDADGSHSCRISIRHYPPED